MPEKTPTIREHMYDIYDFYCVRIKADDCYMYAYIYVHDATVYKLAIPSNIKYPNEIHKVTMQPTSQRSSDMLSQLCFLVSVPLLYRRRDYENDLFTHTTLANLSHLSNHNKKVHVSDKTISRWMVPRYPLILVHFYFIGNKLIRRGLVFVKGRLHWFITLKWFQTLRLLRSNLLRNLQAVTENACRRYLSEVGSQYQTVTDV